MNKVVYQVLNPAKLRLQCLIGIHGKHDAAIFTLLLDRSDFLRSSPKSVLIYR